MTWSLFMTLRSFDLPSHHFTCFIILYHPRSNNHYFFTTADYSSTVSLIYFVIFGDLTIKKSRKKVYYYFWTFITHIIIYYNLVSFWKKVAFLLCNFYIIRRDVKSRKKKLCSQIVNINERGNNTSFLVI